MGTLSTAGRFDDHRVLVSSNPSDRNFLADGESIREVMFANTQIPGQPAGVVWSGEFRAAIYPIDGVGASFSAQAAGPGIGDVPQYVSFIGVPDGPLTMNTQIQNQPAGCTRTGLVLQLARPEALVGPIGGPLQVVLPASYQPPGASGSRSFDPIANYLNNAGRASLSFTAFGNSRNYVVIADTTTVELRAEGSTSLQSDRGVIALRSLVAAVSQPISDGSVFIRGSTQVGNQSRVLLWQARPSGPASIVAMAGDRAPGTEPGVTFAVTSNPFEVYAANRNGSLLFQAALSTPEGPSVALYLWRRGSLTLVARQTAESSLSPGTAPSRSLNSRDEAAFIGEMQAFIYKPGVGTIRVARRGQPIAPSSGLAGNIVSIYPFYGSTIGRVHNSGGDDISVPSLTDDGRLFIAGFTSANPPSESGNFFAAFEVVGTPCPSDFNLDGFTDFFDYLDFVTCFEGGRCPDGKPADFNDDGIADFFDYMEFVDAFERGC
ncbi:MAG: hypothetical protein HEQ23_01960 [Tepidisphaera sp.]